jgi:hypothetical protein
MLLLSGTDITNALLLLVAERPVMLSVNRNDPLVY